MSAANEQHNIMSIIADFIFDSPMSVKFILTGREIKLEVTVSPDGYRLFIVKPRLLIYPYAPSTETWFTLPQLQAALRERNMDIFPDIDAVAYAQKSADMSLPDDEVPLSYKHEPTVNHIYSTMGYYCQTHNFMRSLWNRLSGRREAVLIVHKQNEAGKSGAAVEPALPMQVLVTPERVECVRVEELCTELDQVKLRYPLDPPEQSVSSCMAEKCT